MDSMFFSFSEDKIKCELCPNGCVLKDGATGLCGARKRNGDTIVIPYSGIISSSGLDPIEKKPLYHFKPGSRIFSVGFFGCTLHCGFCQNYSISQSYPGKSSGYQSPEEIISFLKGNDLSSIAFTYSEPTLHYEWVLETAKLCRQNGINTVLVTNGYLNAKPAELLLEHIDAANIDMKSASNEFYEKICSGKIVPVKEFIKVAYGKKVHIEITTLVITDTNDDISECIEIRDFISGISTDIPYHISRYRPEYKFEKPATPVSTINRWIKTAKEKLDFVYGGNIMESGETYCKKCNNLLVDRAGYSTIINGLKKDGTCSKCGGMNYFIM